MRERADWMTQADDRILELLRDRGNLTPAAIEDKGDGYPSSDHASRRARLLVEAGLVEQVHHGLYGLAEPGRKYLDEELDASECPVPDAVSDDTGDDAAPD